MPRRNDARTNRDAILRAADAAFQAGVGPVPLDEIARRTGLGRATVYRHFPDRHALANAVAAENLDAMRRAVNGPPGERMSFRSAIDTLLSTQAVMRPLANLMLELPHSDQMRIVRELIAILTPAFRQAQLDGELRADIEPTDIAMLMVLLNTAAESNPVSPDRPAALERLISILLDGLFTPTPSRGGRAAIPNAWRVNADRMPTRPRDADHSRLA